MIIIGTLFGANNMFKVERIILKKFAGMSLHEVKEFDLTIKSPITIVLGGNGSGKTSLLSVYFPVCPPKEDLQDGGSYTNICWMEDTQYKFFVKRTGSTLHCSITNLTLNEVIVKDVNPKVYNANVEDITGLTKEKKELLNGELSLTKAGTAQRRQWFTMLSASDLSYALSFYARLRKHLSALGNQIDYVRGKIAETKVRVVEDEAERVQLENRLQVLANEIQQLTASLANTPATDPQINEEYVKRILRECAEMGQHLVGADKKIPLPQDMTNLVNTIRGFHEQIASWQGIYVERNKALSQLVDEDSRQQYLMRNHAGLKEQLVNLQGLVREFDNRTFLYTGLFVGQYTTEQLNGANKVSSSFAHRLQVNIDGLTTRETIKSLEERLKAFEATTVELTNKKSQLERLLTEDQSMLQHIRDTDEVSCPNCSHTFKPGVGKLTEADLLQRIHVGTQHITEVANRLSDTVRERTAVVEEIGRLQEIREIVLTFSRDPVLGILFNKLGEEDAFRSHRQKLGGLMTTFFEELQQATQYHRLSSQLEKTQREWDELAKAQGNVDSTLTARIEVQRTAVEEALQSKYRLEEELKFAQSQYKAMENTRTAAENFVELEARLTDALRLHANNVAVKQVEDYRAVRWDQYSIARERHRLMQQELEKLAELEKELARLSTHQHTAKMMVTSFSPEKGVLRHHFFKSIARVTEMMSSYIEHVWAYPMKVLPCDMSEGDLDYRFPYRLKDKEEPVFDICKGSAAQRDIFDLTYRLTAYRCWGFKQYPLLLDEPGATFDEYHRNELVDFVKRLLNSGEFSQIIVISHNSEVHSKLNGADYCVLESEGITLPTVYNQHVKITYND